MIFKKKVFIISILVHIAAFGALISYDTDILKSLFKKDIFFLPKNSFLNSPHKAKKLEQSFDLKTEILLEEDKELENKEKEAVQENVLDDDKKEPIKKVEEVADLAKKPKDANNVSDEKIQKNEPTVPEEKLKDDKLNQASDSGLKNTPELKIISRPKNLFPKKAKQAKPVLNQKNKPTAPSSNKEGIKKANDKSNKKKTYELNPRPENLIKKSEEKKDVDSESLKQEVKKNEDQEKSRNGVDNIQKNNLANLPQISEIGKIEKKEVMSDSTGIIGGEDEVPSAEGYLGSKAIQVSQLTYCWRSVHTPKIDLDDDIYITADISFNTNREVKNIKIHKPQTQDLFLQEIYEGMSKSAYRAILQCSPLSGLDPADYNDWSEILVKFHYSNMQ